MMRAIDMVYPGNRTYIPAGSVSWDGNVPVAVSFRCSSPLQVVVRDEHRFGNAVSSLRLEPGDGIQIPYRSSYSLDIVNSAGLNINSVVTVRWFYEDLPPVFPQHAAPSSQQVFRILQLK